MFGLIQDIKSLGTLLNVIFKGYGIRSIQIPYPFASDIPLFFYFSIGDLPRQQEKQA